MGEEKRARGYRRVCIIGAGPAGASIARICAEAGCEVHVFERRRHVAGQCYDERDEHGILVHRFGPHYFRTSDEWLLKWLSRFTEWLPGRYYVRASVNGILAPMPVSLATMTALKGKPFTEEEFRAYLEEHRVNVPHPRNAEEQCLALVGRELYELLFKGYTEKQWGVHPRELAPSVTARIPLRFNWDERYPSETYQVMPKQGYTALYRNMLDHRNIHIQTDAFMDNKDIEAERKSSDATIYTGPIDKLFDYRYGPLGYRSLRFEWKHFAIPYMQPCVQINFPNDQAYTRIVEIKHVTGQEAPDTTLCYEYPEAKGDPFYPLLTQENRDRYELYKVLADEESRREPPMYLVGRLAEFKYFNMDQVLLRAIKVAHEILERWG